VQELLTPTVVTIAVVASLVTVVAGAVAVPWYFCRIPANHFADQDRPSSPLIGASSPWRLPLMVLKNVAAFLLVLIGVLLLVLPGQGLLTIAAGLLVLDFPGRRRFQRWLVSRRPVLQALNALRRRAHQPPLELERGAAKHER
jgi:hypothetical protein